MVVPNAFKEAVGSTQAKQWIAAADEKKTDSPWRHNMYELIPSTPPFLQEIRPSAQDGSSRSWRTIPSRPGWWSGANDQGWIAEVTL